MILNVSNIRVGNYFLCKYTFNNQQQYTIEKIIAFNSINLVEFIEAIIIESSDFTLKGRKNFYSYTANTIFSDKIEDLRKIMIFEA